MDEKEYLLSRVEEQIQWYDQKSQWNQRWYKRLKIIEITLSVLIPFLIGVISFDLLNKLVIGMLGVLITIIASVLNLYKFQENWIEYRATAEMLKQEKFLFLTKANPYKTVDSFSNFVSRIECIISRENAKWTQYIQKENKEAGNNG